MKTKRRGAEDAEVRREEWLNGDIKNSQKSNAIRKMKSFLRDPLRPPRLCVEKDKEKQD